jgi:hypothetical protein
MPPKYAVIASVAQMVADLVIEAGETPSSAPFNGNELAIYMAKALGGQPKQQKIVLCTFPVAQKTQNTKRTCVLGA